MALNLFGQPRVEEPKVAAPVKKNLLGQPISVEPAKASVLAPAHVGIGGVGAAAPSSARILNRSGESLADYEKAVADSAESPRSKAAKLMKRQAGIGQLTTRHVEEEPLI